MTQDPNPHEALAAIRAARESVPGPTGYPVGYDILYGGVCGLLVAGQGMPQPWSRSRKCQCVSAMVALSSPQE